MTGFAAPTGTATARCQNDCRLAPVVIQPADSSFSRPADSHCHPRYTRTTSQTHAICVLPSRNRMNFGSSNCACPIALYALMLSSSLLSECLVLAHVELCS